MRRFALAPLVVALLATAAHGQSVRDLYRTGQLEEALRAGATDSPAAEYYLALLEKGEAGRALELLPESGRPDLEYVRARALAATGGLDAAESLLRAVDARGGADALRARAELGLLLAARGRLDEAEATFDTLIQAYNGRSTLSEQELVAVGIACHWLGRFDPQLFKDALKAFDEAAAAAPDSVEPVLRIGELFLEKYDSGQAREALGPLLARAPEHPRVLLAMARVHHFDGSPEAEAIAEKALEAAPEHPDVRVFLASLKLEQEDTEGAQALLEEALEESPGHLVAQSYLAAVHFLRGDTVAFQALEQKILTANPAAADLYAVLAEVAVQNRLYPQARDFAARGTEVDSRSWRSFGLLGQNLIRLGQMNEGRAKLDAAFEGDPYNVWIKNTLDLLDRQVDYVETVTPRFRLVIHKDESELLAPILAELAERSYDALEKRYDYSPATPIRIEVYREHADFSVRTVGLAGLGALGVSFGPVIALDSPAARELGSFNFGVTFWHELAHTFTLGYTDSRIPRWLTEGLSVFEEHQSGERGWGDDPSRDFLQALADDKLLSLVELNQGFVRPSFPNQIGLSYYQASLICQLIDERYGWDKMLQLLRGYREGMDTAQTVQATLDKSLEEFNEEYFTWLREERFASALPAFEGPETSTLEALAAGADDHPENFRMQLARGAKLIESERYDDAIPYLERAKETFPEFVGAGSAYEQLAHVYRETEKPRREIAELLPYTETNEYSYLEHRRVASLLQEQGREADEARVLDRARFIYPYDVDLHERLAEIDEEATSAEATARLVRSRRAILALGPANRARAHYALARALIRDGKSREARRQVLSALELAPSYPEAQDLLLELAGGSD